MKRIINTILGVMLFVSLLQAQNNITTSVEYAQSTKLKLTSLIDTATITFGSTNQYPLYTITGKSDGADTVNVYSLSVDGTAWVQHSLVDLSTNTTTSAIVLSTTYKEFALVDPQPLQIRVISTSDDASYDSLIIAGKKGSVSGTAIGGSTVAVSGTYYKEFVATDSILCVSAASHAANTVIGNSATAGSVNWLRFLNVANSASGKIIITGMQINSDSLSAFSGIVFLNNDTTKIAKIADNAQNVFASESFNYRVADIPFSLQTGGVGTGSTGTWDCQYIQNWIATAGADKHIYGKVVATTAAVPKLNGYIRIKIKGWQEVIVP